MDRVLFLDEYHRLPNAQVGINYAHEIITQYQVVGQVLCDQEPVGVLLTSQSEVELGDPNRCDGQLVCSLEGYVAWMHNQPLGPQVLNVHNDFLTH